MSDKLRSALADLVATCRDVLHELYGHGWHCETPLNQAIMKAEAALIGSAEPVDGNLRNDILQIINSSFPQDAVNLIMALVNPRQAFVDGVRWGWPMFNAKIAEAEAARRYGKAVAPDRIIAALKREGEKK